MRSPGSPGRAGVPVREQRRCRVLRTGAGCRRPVSRDAVHRPCLHRGQSWTSLHPRRRSQRAVHPLRGPAASDRQNFPRLRPTPSHISAVFCVHRWPQTSCAPVTTPASPPSPGRAAPRSPASPVHGLSLMSTNTTETLCGFSLSRTGRRGDLSRRPSRVGGGGDSSGRWVTLG